MVVTSVVTYTFPIGPFLGAPLSGYGPSVDWGVLCALLVVAQKSKGGQLVVNANISKEEIREIVHLTSKVLPIKTEEILQSVYID